MENKVVLTKEQEKFLLSFNRDRGSISDANSIVYDEALYAVVRWGWGFPLVNGAGEDYIVSDNVNSIITGVRQRDLKNLLVKALINGYKVEREKFIVEIPSNRIRLNFEHRVFLCRNKDNGVIFIDTAPTFYVKENPKKYQLTEDEIKEDFEWAWEAGFVMTIEEFNKKYGGNVND